MVEGISESDKLVADIVIATAKTKILTAVIGVVLGKLITANTEATTAGIAKDTVKEAYYLGQTALAVELLEDVKRLMRVEG